MFQLILGGNQLLLLFVVFIIKEFQGQRDKTIVQASHQGILQIDFQRLQALLLQLIIDFYADFFSPG